MYFTKENFINKQKVIATFFEHAIKSNRIPQGILFNGNINSPLLETAYYLAQSLVCEKHDLACNLCPSCERFLKGITPDLIVIDGKQSLIKKDQIDKLEDFFSLSSLEKNHRSIYIINQVENITTEAVNGLLKFLEEPQGKITAILTTANKQRVLPTIVSRLQILNLLPTNVDELINDYSGEILIERYYLLSYLAYEEEEKKEINSSKEFDLAYNGAISYLDTLINKKEEASLSLFSDVVNPIKKAGSKVIANKCYNYFYSIVIILLTDALLENQASPYKEFVIKLKPYYKNISKALAFLEDINGKSSANLNFTLALAKLAYIMEGK